MEKFNAGDIRNVANKFMESEEWVDSVQRDIQKAAERGKYSIELYVDNYPYEELEDPERRQDLIEYLCIKGFKAYYTPDECTLHVGWYKL